MKIYHKFIVGLLTLTACTKEEEPPLALVADFTLPSTPAETGTALLFANTSQNAKRYKWQFGDGTPAVTDANPQHVYATRGQYLLKLTAYSNTDSASVTKRLSVKPYDRFAQAGIPVTSTYLTRGWRFETRRNPGTGSIISSVVTRLPDRTLTVIRISPDTLRVNGFLAIPQVKDGVFFVRGFDGTAANLLVIHTVGDSISLNEHSRSGHGYYKTDTYTGPRRP